VTIEKGFAQNLIKFEFERLSPYPYASQQQAKRASPQIRSKARRLSLCEP